MLPRATLAGVSDPTAQPELTAKLQFFGVGATNERYFKPGDKVIVFVEKCNSEYIIPPDQIAFLPFDGAAIVHVEGLSDPRLEHALDQLRQLPRN